MAASSGAAQGDVRGEAETDLYLWQMGNTMDGYFVHGLGWEVAATTSGIPGRSLNDVSPACETGEQWQRALGLLRKMWVAKESPMSISSTVR